MRIILMILMLIFGIDGQAATDAAPLQIVPFEGVQHECRQVEGISFGANGHWANCHVTRGRWVATIDFLDIYQAQYCLGNTPERCEQRAQVIFANRAYTPDATVLLVRIDEAGTNYVDPLVVNSDNDSVMGITSHNAAGLAATQYFVWRADHWAPLDAKHWQDDLQDRLQAKWQTDLKADLKVSLLKSTSAREVSAVPDLETMSAKVQLYNTEDADCCPSGGVATVLFGLNTAALDASGLENKQFVVKNLIIQH